MNKNKSTNQSRLKAKPSARLKNAETALKSKAAAPAPRTVKTAKNTPANQKRISVVFVCTGNTCRSPMAEQIFRNYLKKKRLLTKFTLCSAGVYAQSGSFISPEAVDMLNKLNITPKISAARRINDNILRNSDYIFCMTGAHKAEILRARIKSGARIFSIAEITGGPEVTDPFGCGVFAYKEAAEYLLYACGDLLKTCFEGREEI